MTGMPTRDEILDHYASVSGRQVDDIDYYCILAKWKLAVVLEQGFQRAGERREAACLRPDRARPDARRGRVGEHHLVQVKAAWCASYGAPIAVRDVDGPAPTDGEVRVAVHAASVNFPDVLMTRGEYQIKVPAPFVPGSEFAGVVTDVPPTTSSGFRSPSDRNPGKVAVGDRVFGSALVGAFAEEVVVRRDVAHPHSRRRGLRGGGGIRCRAPHGVALVAQRCLSAGGAAGDRARRRRRSWPRGGATCTRPRGRGHRGRVDGGEALRPRATAARRCWSTIATSTCARR